MYFIKEEDERDRQIDGLVRLEEERDPFEGFGDLETANDDDAYVLAEDEDITVEAPDFTQEEEAANENTARAPAPVKTGFSWAGFTGGLAALVWVAAAIGGPLSYFGQAALLAMDPAMQAGLIALAFGPALLFWLSASAAGEALKARRLATELARIAQDARTPIEGGKADAKELASVVKSEIESLNDAVAAALDRLSELETAAQRNAALFSETVAASRENTEAVSQTLIHEREALAELNGDLKSQAETVANSIGRQVRLMREASKLMKVEIVAAENTLEAHLASFADSASIMGERTAAFQHVANDAAVATDSLNGTMANMLEGLAEATRLSETARKSSEQAVAAASETAGALHETTRTAVFEAKRAAQLIRAETVAMQETANDTLAKLQEAAHAARAASEESQAAADRHTAQIEKRLGALASAAGANRAPIRGGERTAPAPSLEISSEQRVAAAVSSLHAVSASVRQNVRPDLHTSPVQPAKAAPRAAGWTSFMPPRTKTPTAANESNADLVAFGHEPRSQDEALKSGAVNLVFDAGVDLDEVLKPADLDRIARSSRDGANARRRAVLTAAPGAVGRITRHLQRSSGARDQAIRFRARPDLAKSEQKGEASDLVRAYLLIDAALA